MIGKGGFRIIGLVALSAAAAGCTAQQKSQQSQPQAPQQAVAMPADLQTAVLDAELWGHALYDSYTAPNVGNDKAVERAIETVHQSVKDHCTGTYRAVAVVPPSATKDRIVIYDIGEAPASQAIMLPATGTPSRNGLRRPSPPRSGGLAARSSPLARCADSTRPLAMSAAS